VNMGTGWGFYLPFDDISMSIMRATLLTPEKRLVALVKSAIGHGGLEWLADVHSHNDCQISCISVPRAQEGDDTRDAALISVRNNNILRTWTTNKVSLVKSSEDLSVRADYSAG
jgi:hypothetical protein